MANSKSRAPAAAARSAPRSTVITTGHEAPNGTPKNGASANGASMNGTSAAQALIDAALANVGELEAAAQPVNVEEIGAAALYAARDGMRAAETMAKEWPAGASVQVVLFCLPEDWRDAEAAAMLGKLTEDEQALLLAWLTNQWWGGYGVGQDDHAKGHDLRQK